MTSDARFTLRLDPELKQWLEAEAARQDRSVAWLAKRAIETMKEEADAFDRIVEEAAAEADDGIFVSSEAVHAWLDALETEPNTPPPEPDVFLKQA